MVQNEISWKLCICHIHEDKAVWILGVCVDQAYVNFILLISFFWVASILKDLVAVSGLYLIHSVLLKACVSVNSPKLSFVSCYTGNEKIAIRCFSSIFWCHSDAVSYLVLLVVSEAFRFGREICQTRVLLGDHVPDRQCFSDYTYEVTNDTLCKMLVCASILSHSYIFRYV